MTAYEIINSGFALAGERLDSWPDKDIALSWLNTAVALSADAEKLIRQKNKAEFTGEVPYIRQLSDTVEMDIKICRTCLPLAIAYLLLTDRERDYNAQQMKNRFYSALKEAAKGREMAVADCYGGEVL